MTTRQWLLAAVVVLPLLAVRAPSIDPGGARRAGEVSYGVIKSRREAGWRGCSGRRPPPRPAADLLVTAGWWSLPTWQAS